MIGIAKAIGNQDSKDEVFYELVKLGNAKARSITERETGSMRS